MLSFFPNCLSSSLPSQTRLKVKWPLNPCPILSAKWTTSSLEITKYFEHNRRSQMAIFSKLEIFWPEIWAMEYFTWALFRKYGSQTHWLYSIPLYSILALCLSSWLCSMPLKDRNYISSTFAAVPKLATCSTDDSCLANKYLQNKCSIRLFLKA